MSNQKKRRGPAGRRWPDFLTMTLWASALVSSGCDESAATAEGDTADTAVPRADAGSPDAAPPVTDTGTPDTGVEVFPDAATPDAEAPPGPDVICETFGLATAACLVEACPAAAAVQADYAVLGAVTCRAGVASDPALGPAHFAAQTAAGCAGDPEAPEFTLLRDLTLDWFQDGDQAAFCDHGAVWNAPEACAAACDVFLDPCTSQVYYPEVEHEPATLGPAICHLGCAIEPGIGDDLACLAGQPAGTTCDARVGQCDAMLAAEPPPVRVQMGAIPEGLPEDWVVLSRRVPELAANTCTRMQLLDAGGQPLLAAPVQANCGLRTDRGFYAIVHHWETAMVRASELPGVPVQAAVEFGVLLPEGQYDWSGGTVTVPVEPPAPAQLGDRCSTDIGLVECPAPSTCSQQRCRLPR